MNTFEKLRWCLFVKSQPLGRRACTIQQTLHILLNMQIIQQKRNCKIIRYMTKSRVYSNFPAKTIQNVNTVITVRVVKACMQCGRWVRTNSNLRMLLRFCTILLLWPFAIDWTSCGFLTSIQHWTTIYGENKYICGNVVPSTVMYSAPASPMMKDESGIQLFHIYLKRIYLTVIVYYV